MGLSKSHWIFDFSHFLSASNETIFHFDSFRMMQVPKPWKQSFLSAYAAMEHDLHITNPTLLAVLGLWHRNYRYVRNAEKNDTL